jgi:hypothetical protein
MQVDLYPNTSTTSEIQKIPENISEDDVLYWAQKMVSKHFGVTI